MSEMKDSGLEWIGMIPKHWDIHPVYYYFGERKNKNFALKEQNLLSLSYGKIIRKDIETLGGLLPASFNTYNIVEKGDIIIRPTDLQNDKRSLRTGLVTEHGIITSAYIDLMPKNNADSRYYHYLLHSYDVMKVFYNMGNGVRQGLNYSEFAKMMVFAPPINEQIAIANFLDHKCSEIDSLTADIQSQIDILEEYKKSVITEAVTKGLNPDVEMKDSGIEWMGKIPKHWNTMHLKHLCSFKTGGTPPNNAGINMENNGYPWITASDMDDTLKINNSTKYITEEMVKQCKYQLFPPNSILLICIASVGKMGIINKYSYSNQQITALKPNNNAVPMFLLYQIKTMENNIIADAHSNVVPIINTSYLSKIKCLLPPISEQQKIADYLDTKCSEIDAIITDKKAQLEILVEYKKSLIYEYVTGKKEVPADV